MRRLGYVPALDGLRGVAIAAVVLYHGGFFRGGFIGVDLFFVLSGFLITTLLLEEHADTESISFRRFYERRARRLLPVAILGIVLAELLLLRVRGVHHHGLEPLVGVFALFYVENFAHFLHPPVISLLGHYWTLSQEEQFYFLWPPILVLLLRRRVSLERLAIVLVGLAVAVIAHRALVNDWWRLYGPDTRSDGMLLGCAVAAAWKAQLLRPHPLLRIAAPAAFAVFVLDAAIVAPGSASLYGITVANLAAVIMIVSLLARPNGLLTSLLAIWPLRMLGLISYSLYIWQPLVASISPLEGVRMIVVSLIIACLSYQLVEKPFRRRRHAPVPEPGTAPAAAASATPVEA